MLKYNVPFIVLAIAFVIVCILLITVIILQKKREAGLGAAGIGQTQNTFWDKNKGRSVEGKLETYTIILGALFFIIAIAIGFFS